MFIAALAFAAAAATPAGGIDAPPAKALQLTPKSAIATMAPMHRYAPFVEALSEPGLVLLPHHGARVEQSRSSCSGERALCYDPGSGRIVYKPARALMPDIPGLQRENISVKRDRIVLRYSF